MILRPTSRRAGASLVEVLVGFGILGIGVTSVITLFPFSALTLGQALRDDRTTTCAAMADGQMRDVHQRLVVEPEADKAKTGGSGSNEDYFKKFQTPGTPGLTGFALSPSESGPSYPVFVDPMGRVARFGAGNAAVGDNGETGVPRVTLSIIINEAMALRYCSLMDSLTFGENGDVDNTSANLRELRYNYAWMLQRPVHKDPSTVRMQVVVYNRRTHLYAPPGTELVIQNVTFIPGETTITVPSTGIDIRKGMWVMDGTIDPNHADGDGVVRPLRHAEFYRVVSVTESGGNTLLEVHKPVTRADGLISPASPASMGYINGKLVVMPGVADVFERPVLTAKH